MTPVEITGVKPHNPSKLGQDGSGLPWWPEFVEYFERVEGSLRTQGTRITKDFLSISCKALSANGKARTRKHSNHSLA